MRQVLKGVSVLLMLVWRGLWLRAPRRQDIIITYHMVGEGLPRELNVSKEAFEAQMRYLSQHYNMVSLSDLMSGNVPSPAAAVTFDDGYRSFLLEALPVMERLRVPSTLFVCTGLIDEGTELLTFGSSQGVSKLSWEEVGILAKHDLVDVGAHSHHHLNYTLECCDRVRRDIETSNDLFKAKLGFVPEYFAYPRGLHNRRVRSIVSEYYLGAFTTSNGLLSFSNAFKVGRISSRRSDSMSFFSLRLLGLLEFEEFFMLSAKEVFLKSRNRARKLLRRVGARGA